MFSGYPSVKSITDTVTKAKNIARNSDLNYYIFQKDTNCGYVENIQKLLSHLIKIVSDYNSRLNINSVPNYEDLYYLIRQLSDSETKEYENPALLPLINEIELKFTNELKLFRSEPKEFMRESLRYIHYVVFQLLKKDPDETKQIQILTDYVLAKSDYHFDIYSLNHDRAIESHFQYLGININTGFNKSGAISVWSSKSLNKVDQFNLFKLHGSVDWFNFQDRYNNGNIYQIPLDYDPQIDGYYELDER